MAKLEKKVERKKDTAVKADNILMFNLDKVERAKIAVAIAEGKCNPGDTFGVKKIATKGVSDDNPQLLVEYLKLGGYAEKNGVEIPYESWRELEKGLSKAKK